MISTRILLLLVLTCCAYGHKIVKEDQEQPNHNVGIVGGHEISIKQAPFMASIRIHGLIHWCGGSIIHERFILTSAQCVELNDYLTIYVGSEYLYERGTEYSIEKTIIHEQYSNETGDYDVALLKLNKPLTFGPTVSRVLLTGNGDLRKVKLGTMLNITGWGFEYREAYQLSNILQQTTVPVVSNHICEQSIKNVTLTKRMMCTDAIKDACVGDEGGPLTWNNIQIGIITAKSGCGEFPSVYTKVKTVNRWIKKTIKHHDKKEN